jgi:hypothetical protein
MIAVRKPGVIVPTRSSQTIGWIVQLNARLIPDIFVSLVYLTKDLLFFVTMFAQDLT